MKKINILRKASSQKKAMVKPTGAGKEIRPREVLRCGSRTTHINYSRRADGKIIGTATYHSDYSTPQLKEVFTVMQTMQDAKVEPGTPISN